MARQAGILTAEDVRQLQRKDAAVLAAINVDDFAPSVLSPKEREGVEAVV